MKFECCSFIFFWYNIITVIAIQIPHRSANIERKDWRFDNVRQHEAKTTRTKEEGEEDIRTGRRLFKRMDPPWYRTLGISPVADEAETRKAYRKLAMQYHPDKATEEQKAAHEEKMKTINSAYEKSKHVQEERAKRRPPSAASRPATQQTPPSRPAASGAGGSTAGNSAGGGSSYGRSRYDGDSNPFPGFRPPGSSNTSGGTSNTGSSSRPSSGRGWDEPPSWSGRTGSRRYNPFRGNGGSSSGSTGPTSRAQEREPQNDSPPLNPFGPSFGGSGRYSSTSARGKVPDTGSPHPGQSSGSSSSRRTTSPFSGYKGSFTRDGDSHAGSSRPRQPDGPSGASSSGRRRPSTSSSDDSPPSASSSRNRAGTSDQPGASSSQRNSAPNEPFRWTSPGGTTYAEASTQSQFRWKSPGGTEHRQSSSATDSFYARQQHAEKAWRNAQDAMRGTGAWSSFSNNKSPPRPRPYDSRTGFGTSGGTSRSGSSESPPTSSQQPNRGSSMPRANAGQSTGSTGTGDRTSTRPTPGSNSGSGSSSGSDAGVEPTRPSYNRPDPGSGARATFTRPGPGYGPKFARTRVADRFPRTQFTARPSGTESTTPQPGIPPVSGNPRTETASTAPVSSSAGSTARTESVTKSSGPAPGTVPGTTNTPWRAESAGSTNIKQPPGSSASTASSGANKSTNPAAASSSGSTGSVSSGTASSSAFQRARQTFNNPTVNRPSGPPGSRNTSNPGPGTRFPAPPQNREEPARENRGARTSPIPTRAGGIKDLISKFEGMNKPRGKR